MPSVSKKQHNFMTAIAHSPEFAKKAGVPMSVGKDFTKADKGKTFRHGGSSSPAVQGINKQKTHHGSIQMPNSMLNKHIGYKTGGSLKGKDMALNKLFKGKESYSEELKEAKAIKSGKITPQQYAKGEKMEGHAKGGRITSKGEHAVQKQSKRGAEMVKMAKGGLAMGHKSADGIAVKGKTRAMRPEMCGGGMAKKK